MSSKIPTTAVKENVNVPTLEQPVSTPEQTPAEKKKHGNAGKKPTEKQIEGLRKGMEALKAKREAMKQKKAEKDKKKQSGEPVSDSDDDTPAPKKAVAPAVAPVVKERKPRADKGTKRKPDEQKYASRADLLNELSSFKSTLLNELKTTPVVKVEEKIKEVPVERLVEKVVEKPTTKVLTGSELLNAIFFSK